MTASTMTDLPLVTALDSDVGSLISTMRAAGRQPFEALGVGDARAMYRAGRDTTQLLPAPLPAVEDIAIAGNLPARVYRPKMDAASAPAVLFFHGGGWVIGDLDTHDGICRRLALSSGRVVVAVNYRLAPEHRFPAAVDDALAAHAALVENAAALGIDVSDIAVAGDSAGGGLAAIVAITSRSAGRPAPVAAALFYPVTDLRGGTASYDDVRNVPITAATMHWFRDLYLATPEVAADWRASPLLAPSLDGFPRTFITSAGHDPLRDEAFAFAARLREAGVTVAHRHLPGQVHGYLTLGRILREAERSIDAAGAFLSARNCQ